jgi:hypothetical protein
MLSNISIILGLLFIFLINTSGVFAASPASTNFMIEEYGFGSGGVASASSTNFLLYGLTGEVETGSPSSTNFIALPGLTFTLQPNIPAPTVTNPSNYYNKLNVVVSDGGYPTDTTYAIQVASNSGSFTQDVYYVQADHTLGLSPVWQTYSSWGSGSGFTLIGLYPGTTYYVRTAAKRGVYQQGPWSPTASAATSISTFTFSLQTTSQVVPPFSVNIGNLTPGAVTTSSDKVTATISTNATGGGLVYVYGTNNGLKSTYAGNYTITSNSNDLSAALEGYGARGTTVTQSAGGPMQLISPYNGSSDNVGIIDTAKRTLADSSSQPITSGQVSFELKAKAKQTTPSATDYSDTLTVIATGSF